MKKLINYALLSIIGLFIISCSATLEGETEDYASNKKKLETLKTTMPRYASIIDEHKAQLETKWTEAQAVTGEEAKIEALEAVNDQVYAGEISNFRGVQSQISKLTSTLNRLKSYKNAVYDIEYANSKIDKIKASVQQPSELSKADLQAEAGSFVSTLKDLNSGAEKELKRVKKIAKDKKKAEKAAKAKKK